MPTNDYSKNIVYLSKEQYQELITNETLTVNGQTITYNENDIYVTPQAEPITDVRMNGTSISNNGIANIPVAGNGNAATSTLGVVKGGTGIKITSGGVLSTDYAYVEDVKNGTSNYLTIAPKTVPAAAFYGLSKVAGVDLKNETVTLGTYPDSSKAAIQSMLGITDLIASSEAATATAAHAENSIFMMDGKLMRATTAIAAADAVEVGTNCEVTSISEVFATNTNLNLKADKADSVFTGTMSLGRKANTTIGNSSIALGQNVEASGMYSFAEGCLSIASNFASHAEGLGIASGSVAHAEGNQSIASGNFSHAEGTGTESRGYWSHTQGFSTIAEGAASHVIGTQNVIDNFDNWEEWQANKQYQVHDKVKITTVENNETIITTYYCKTANNDAIFTETNWEKNLDNFINYIEIVGNGYKGYNSNSRSNARTLDWEGNEYLNGYLYVGCNADSTGGVRVPHDVQVNGTSVVSNGVANVPLAGHTQAGVVRVNTSGLYGTSLVDNGNIATNPATDDNIKQGTGTYKPVTPNRLEKAVYFGLSKLAGEDLKNDTVTVGTYPEKSKSAISDMLNAPETVSGTTPSITGKSGIRYVCGELTALDFTPPETGDVEIMFTSGSSPTALTVTPPSVNITAIKWPSWFDPDNLEANAVYDLIITNGEFGMVALWT